MTTFFMLGDKMFNIDEYENGVMNDNGGVRIYNKVELLENLAELDGEAKWFIEDDNVYLIDSFADVSGVKWDYIFSDELECADWETIEKYLYK